MGTLESIHGIKQGREQRQWKKIASKEKSPKSWHANRAFLNQVLSWRGNVSDEYRMWYSRTWKWNKFSTDFQSFVRMYRKPFIRYLHPCGQNLLLFISLKEIQRIKTENNTLCSTLNKGKTLQHENLFHFLPRLKQHLHSVHIGLKITNNNGNLMTKLNHKWIIIP